jgi:hypothetical protein
MINETIPRIFHEPDVMKRNDPPPRSAEELWKLAKTRKNMLYAGSGSTMKRVSKYDSTIDQTFLPVTDNMKNYQDSGVQNLYNVNTAALLYPAKESDMPMLPLPLTLPVLPDRHC